MRIKHTKTYYPVCPYCGDEDEYGREEHFPISECALCGKLYTVEVHVHISFTTSKIDQEKFYGCPNG